MPFVKTGLPGPCYLCQTEHILEQGYRWKRQVHKVYSGESLKIVHSSQDLALKQIIRIKIKASIKSTRNKEKLYVLTV